MNEKTGLKWGTYNLKDYVPKNLVWKDLGDLTSEHLINIIITETWHLPKGYVEAISNLLRNRGIHLKEGDLEKVSKLA